MELTLYCQFGILLGFHFEALPYIQQITGMLYHGNVGSKMSVAQEFSQTPVNPIHWH